MANNFETPFKAPKRGIPWELIAEFRMRSYSNVLKGFFYVIREEFGAETALRLYDRLCTMDDRIKNMTNFLKTVFKIEGNDAETIADWLVIWYEIFGFEYDVLERSKTISRIKITKCPWKTGYKDVGEWCTIWGDLVYTTINPKATQERPKGMCAGDPYCELINKIED